ncbi:zinc finger protein-domain-containing protein [Alternaria rosae]|uniref:zinc finger protein-domain-containing protein n=1 Tax=Alternaria rosae TaxID=1187941 RepID=UPI001E8D5A3A|nr:zinc finger protein-domain-containing protein [Alternaria rosae]KAH6858855.1 zinc finger protein-domain-containing protein [Alternaria rosae]
MNTPTSNSSTFREIGRGCCGSIWTLADANWVIKRELMHTNRSVFNDQIMHRRVIAADTTHTLPVRIPQSYEVLEADDAWWDSNLSRFPPGEEVSRSYRQERVPAVGLPNREMLVDKYCRESLRDATRKSKRGEDCLIRLYTGKRRPKGRPPGMFFNLRNYGLCVDQMEELGLDPVSIAKAPAEALAHCYWKAEVDANDVEFVLAPATATVTVDSSIPIFRLLDQGLVIWMLDYDCVRHMTQDADGIAQAVHAFWRNDPYFPRPFAYGHTSVETELWQAFKAHFLGVSRRMLIDKERSVGEKILYLPQEWVMQVEAEGSRRAARQEERRE